MNRILSYEEFPEILGRVLDHVDAQIGRDHTRYDDLPVSIRFRGYMCEGTQVPDSVGLLNGPALVFPATSSRPELTLIAIHFQVDWSDGGLSFHLVGLEGELLETWEVDTEIVSPFEVCRIDVAKRATHSVSEPDTPHTLLRLPEYLQEGIDPGLSTLYDDMVRVIRRHLNG